MAGNSRWKIGLNIEPPEDVREPIPLDCVLASPCSCIGLQRDHASHRPALGWIAGLGVQFRHKVANERDCVFKSFVTKVWHVRELVLEQQFHHVTTEDSLIGGW